MGQIRWYKRDPNAALTGMANLTLEERGAYNTVLDLIYAHDGQLDDHERHIAGWLRVDVRIWRRIRKKLIELGKLYIHAGQLHNERADYELHQARERIRNSAKAGLASAGIRDARKRILNGLVTAPVERRVQPTTTIITNKNTSSEPITARERMDQPPQVALQQFRPQDVTRDEFERTFAKKRTTETSGSLTS